MYTQLHIEQSCELQASWQLTLTFHLLFQACAGLAGLIEYSQSTYVCVHQLSTSNFSRSEAYKAVAWPKLSRSNRGLFAGPGLLSWLSIATSAFPHP